MATWGKGLPGRWNSTRSPRWQSLQHMQGPARAQGAHMGPLRGGWRSETERVGPVRAQGSPEHAGLSSTCCGSTGGEMTQVLRMDEVPEGGFCSNPGWNGQPWGGGRERETCDVLWVCAGVTWEDFQVDCCGVPRRRQRLQGSGGQPSMQRRSGHGVRP